MEKCANNPLLRYSEVRRLLAEEAVGEVKLVKAYFGSPQLHIPRAVKRELGGRCPAGHRCVLLAVCADGVRWREARIHSSDGGAS